MYKSKYKFELSDKFLSDEEIKIFNDFLKYESLDENIWNVFRSMFRSVTKRTRPLLLKIYDNYGLCGSAVIIKCSKYGRSLFDNKFLAKFVDMIDIPFYLWIKFGCCMDMMSNPGFIKDINKKDEVYSAAAEYLKSKSILSIINDYSSNFSLYPQASTLPALPHATVDLSGFDNVLDYINEHKNIKRKLKSFNRKGGSFEIVRGNLSLQQIESLKSCFMSTAEKSVFYLPYQDLYLESAINTSQTELNDVYYFIAKMNGEFLGYQAAIKTGSHLNALHGAFDRTRQTNCHAYDLLFVQMVEFAVENDLSSIDYGAVVSLTKQRMVNKRVDMSYYIFSKFSIVQLIFNYFLKITKIQGKEQMKYR